MHGIAKTTSKYTSYSGEEENPATSLGSLVARKQSAATRESGTRQALQKRAKGGMIRQRASVQRNLSQFGCVHHYSAWESNLRTILESREPDAKGQNRVKLANMIQKYEKSTKTREEQFPIYTEVGKALTIKAEEV